MGVEAEVTDLGYSSDREFVNCSERSLDTSWKIESTFAEVEALVGDYATQTTLARS